MLRGNPEGDPRTMIDAGFTKPVVALVYDEDNPVLSRDGRFTLPENTYSYPETSCSRSEDAQDITNEFSYAASLERDVSVSGSAGAFGVSASFSASYGMKRTENEEFIGTCAPATPTRSRPRSRAHAV